MDQPKTQELPRDQRMIGIGCIAPIRTSNRFQVQSGLGTRQHGERVREVTEWSLPRVGPFFAGRDDTTVLHTVRRMEGRAARDPALHAYMASIKQVRPVGGLPPPPKTRARHAGEVVFSGRIRGRAANVSARAPTRVIAAGPLAAAWHGALDMGPISCS